ncbi:MAG TPA: FAD/NAD(P)-binding protein [Xanthomonadaceae bacterium]|jgi:uncharacterized NAD(P)/FAD-binding protein YdhS
MRRIAVIGGGAAGATVVAELLRRDGGMELLWFTGQHRPGRGVAYATSQGNHLLNVHAANMGLLADDPGGLARYLWKRRLPWTSGDFVPRALFGDYIEDTLTRWIGNCPPGASIDTIASEVVALRPSGTGYAIETDDRRRFVVDGAVLAVGALPPVPIAEVKGDALASGRYLPDPWQRRHIPFEPQQIVVLGSGLTAVDAILTATAHWPDAAIVALSRHGRLPAVHESTPSPPFAGAQALIERLRFRPAIRHWVRLVRKTARGQGADWRAIVDCLHPVTTELWRLLDGVQRGRFLRHVRWAWEAVRHRSPPASAKTIEQLRMDGQLFVLAGRVRRIEGTSPLLLTYTRRKDGSPGEFAADLVVQATGLQTQVARTTHPLLRQMLREGLVRTDAQRLGIAADIDGRVIRADGMVAPTLRVIGPLMRGVLWECTALPEIRMSAARLARDLSAELQAERPFSDRGERAILAH